MACKRCEISTFIKDNGVELFFVTEKWLSAQGDEAKTVELAPSELDVKSFPRNSRYRGGGIATIYKSTLGSNITFKANWFYSHIVRSSAGINYSTTQHTSFFLKVPPSTKPTKQSYWLYVYWTAAWPSRLRKQPPRICLSCWWYEYPHWQSITITNQAHFDYF